MRQFLTVEFWMRGNRPWYGSLGGSVFVHLCVLAVLAVVWIEVRQESGGIGLDSRLSTPMDAPDLLQVEPPSEPAVQLSADSGGRRRGEHTTFESSSPRAIASPSAGQPSVAGLLSDIPSDAELASAVGPPRLPAAGVGSGSGAGEGDGEGDGFFQIAAEGKRFVFVVDRSLSMNHPHHEAKTRFGRVKMELIKAIAHMHEEQLFYIIFFNEGALPMPASGLQPASDNGKKKYLYWLENIKAAGNTDPTQALAMALRLQPDVIFFLTDGEFRHRVVKDVARWNQGRVAIHTICFGSQEGEELLKQIAAQNRGQYKFVP